MGTYSTSGKSYIIGGCILKDSQHKQSCHYLIMTTAPNETIQQLLSVFQCSQFESNFQILS